jgi:8-oxo-dGTP pyrophosphatase MutT (NUDIX family)
MRVLVVGAKGNMGKRYCSILRYLGHEPVEIDEPWPDIIPQDWTHAIVATPTLQHWAGACDLLSHTQDTTVVRHVLMEKPISFSLHLTAAIREILEESNMRLSVVNQYNYLPEVRNAPPRAPGGELRPSWYRFYNHGKDGLHWDCFQIYALAEGEVQLSNTCPLWDCAINGQRIDIAHMDWAYIDMVDDFLHDQKRVWRWDVIDRTTRRILENQ